MKIFIVKRENLLLHLYIVQSPLNIICYKYYLLRRLFAMKLICYKVYLIYKSQLLVSEVNAENYMQSMTSPMKLNIQYEVGLINGRVLRNRL